MCDCMPYCTTFVNCCPDIFIPSDSLYQCVCYIKKFPAIFYPARLVVACLFVMLSKTKLFVCIYVCAAKIVAFLLFIHPHVIVSLLFMFPLQNNSSLVIYAPTANCSVLIPVVFRFVMLFSSVRFPNLCHVVLSTNSFTLHRVRFASRCCRLLLCMVSHIFVSVLHIPTADCFVRFQQFCVL